MQGNYIHHLHLLTYPSSISRFLIFAHQDSRHTALQQLESIAQQPREPITQFAFWFVQILRRADANMSEDIKLFFLWPRIRHDLCRRVRDQGPKTLHEAILTA